MIYLIMRKQIMKKLYTPECELNDNGTTIKNHLIRAIDPIFSSYSHMGYCPNDLSNILIEISNQLKYNSVDFLKNYFNDKKYNTDRLYIKNNTTTELKLASYAGMVKNNVRIWKYENDYTPIMPFEVIEENGHKFWRLIIDINSE